MPITFQIDVDQNLILTTASGTLTDEDVLGLKTQLVQHPDFRLGMGELSDIRNIDRLAVTPAGVRAMVQQDKDHQDHVASHKLALVISEDVAFGMARMYQMLTESTMENVGVFRDLDEAKAWLQVG